MQSIVTDLFFCSLQVLLLTVVDMMKLEKVEFGGVRGRALSQQVLWLHEEFLERYKVLSERSHDCLDVCNLVRRRQAVKWFRHTDTHFFSPLTALSALVGV